VTDNDGMAPGEVSRQLADLKLTVREGFQGMNARLDQYVRLDVYEARRQQDHDRIIRLERQIADGRTGTRWGIGTAVTIVAVIASVLMGVIALFVR
jgi:hypothetical protein